MKRIEAAVLSGLMVGLLSMGMTAALATAVKAAEGEFDPSEYSRGFFECYRDGYFSVTGEMATKVGLPPLVSFGSINYETGCMRGFNEGVRDGDLRNEVVKAAKVHPDFPPEGFEEGVRVEVTYDQNGVIESIKPVVQTGETR